MPQKPTYEELEQKVKDLEIETIKRKRAEESSKVSEEKYRFLAEGAFEAIVWHDEGRIIYANEQYYKMFGYQPEELKDKDSILLTATPDSVKFMKIQISLGRLGPYEVMGMKKDGTEFPMEIRVKNMPYKGKKARMAAIRNLTNQKQAEEALRESEIKHKTLVHNIPGMVYRGYPDWSAEIISGSVAVCGYTDKELNSEEENWLSIIHADDKERVLKKGAELAKRKQRAVQTYRIITKDGDICWVEDRKTSLFNEKGDFIGIEGVVFDITDRKRTEEALRQARDELESRVEERTKELESKTKSLEELNTAMKVLLKKREEDKTEVEQNVMTNVRELILPYFDKINETKLDDHQKAFVDILESNLNEIISPFTRTLSTRYLTLTPKEIQIVNMIKIGYPSKKIAKIMKVSPRTIDTHRKNIRQKVGLGKKRANLRSHLLAHE